MANLKGDSSNPKIPAVEGDHSANGIGVLASSEQSIAVRAVAKKDTAVFATSDTGIGIDARSVNSIGIIGSSQKGVGVQGKGGTYAGYFEGNVAVTGKFNVGNVSIAQNALLMAQSTSHIYTVGLNGEESSLSFAHPVDGHYTIMLDGRNNKLSVGSVLIDGNAGDVAVTGNFNVGNVNAGNVAVTGNFNVGNVSIAQNALLMAQSTSHIYTVGLNGEESSLSFAHPVDGHYTIMLDGRNNKLSVGSVLIDGNAGDVILQNGDCAEDFEIVPAAEAEPGSVMTLNDSGQLELGTRPYDRRAAGVVSGAGEFKPGLILGRRAGWSERLPIALVGRVYCKVDANYEPIEVGDLLTTSATPGHAMKATDVARSFGAVIGKALRPLRDGTGLIPILIALQ